MKVDFDFSLVKSEVQSSLVILKSRPMLPAYFCHVPFMKISTSCLWYSLSILKVTFLKSNPFRFKETLILFNIKYKWHHEKGGAIRHCYGKCWSKLLLTKQTFDLFFSQSCDIKSEFSSIICSYLRRLVIQNSLKGTETLQIFFRSTSKSDRYYFY